MSNANDTITLKSAHGLTATIPEQEYNAIVAEYQGRAREIALSRAGAALKHRRALAQYDHQTITAEQAAEIDQIARALVRDNAIIAAVNDLGYGVYAARVAAGRPVNPAQWGNILARARASVGDIDDTPDRSALDEAARLLGLLTADDVAGDTRPTWTINAPDEWDRQVEGA